MPRLRMWPVSSTWPGTRNQSSSVEHGVPWGCKVGRVSLQDWDPLEQGFLTLYCKSQSLINTEYFKTK